jgi:hypothetical protein
MRGFIVLASFFLLNCLNVAAAVQAANAPVWQPAQSAWAQTIAMVAE